MSSPSTPQSPTRERRTTGRWSLPDLGLGLGLRAPHIGDILTSWPEVGWLEIITENFLVHRGYLSWCWNASPSATRW